MRKFSRSFLAVGLVLAVAGTHGSWPGAAAFAQHAPRSRPAQQHELGIFSESTDIGPALKGATAYDAVPDTYRITGGGADLWGSADAFHFDWKVWDGDGAVQADVAFPAGTHPPNEKAVLMFRQSLDPGSVYADIAIHADGHITLQWRAVQGGATDDIEADAHGAKTLRIERHGAVYAAFATGADGKLTQFASAVIAMHDPLYAGIGVCAHDAQGVATVTFSRVSLTRADMAHPPE